MDRPAERCRRSSAGDGQAGEQARPVPPSARPVLSRPPVPPVPSPSRRYPAPPGPHLPGAATGQLRISVLESGGSSESHGSGLPGGPVHPSHERVSVPPWLKGSGDGETLHVALHVSGTAAVVRGGTEVLLEPGGIVFCGPGTLVLPRPGDPYRMTVFHVPRRLMPITDAELRRVMGVPLSCAEGVGGLVSHFLSVLAAGRELDRPRTGDRLVANAVEILAVLVTGFVGAQGTDSTDSADSGTRMVARITNHIELHLADPDLSPRSIARAHHISVRYLHKLFQGEGTTVSRLVLRRRLEACRRELVGSPRRGLTVAAVAHRWGFVSPSHFSRAFRDAYGVSPSEWQASGTSSERTQPGRSLTPAGNGSSRAGRQRLLSV
ncbi:AraC family transcriptional regulator [Streptomyces sp. NBC_00102]|uniref:helix-turn-helix transcriptional regulator n=1 Tax=Streptomyces sp. NBC_00102 TaxID=2975652 RepID=UPI00225AAC2E|nr:AraC family transcriptional regulator [Streptomyces sp. NBC_00102]MCX5401670.1 AraC family transcriptional regulator [Streptomyces sp. NBC_00102]